MNPNLIDNLGWAMAQVYASVTDRLLINLARHFKLIREGEPVPKSWEYQVQKLAEMGQVTRESAAIIAQSLDGADAALQTMLETAIRDGLKTTEPQLRKAAEKGLLLGQGFLPPELAPNQMQAFQAYYRQSADKLNLVNTVMLESTQAAYTGTISDIVTRINNTQQILNTASGEVITGVSSVNQAIRGGVRKMVDNGLTGFIDHGGHHWSPEAYVAMDTRTTVANTARAAVFERMESYADDLYVVSYHNGARPLCYPWQLKVISRSDWTGEVEDLDGNKIHVYAQSETSYGEPAGLFGINCKHYPSPFIPGVSTIHGEPQDEKENEKAYAESQEQRRLEREVRKEKRELEVMRAQGASDNEIKAQNIRVRNAESDLRNFCKETGRPRQPDRETAPINAKFPDGHQQTRFGERRAAIDSSVSDVTDEYLRKASDNPGTVRPGEGFSSTKHANEIDMAQSVSAKFGGDITTLAERNPAGEYNPDYLWRGKYWELKTPEGFEGIDGLVRKGLKQIEKNPGGIIVDARNVQATHEQIYYSVFNRFVRSARGSADMILYDADGQIHAYRFKKR